MRTIRMGVFAKFGSVLIPGLRQWIGILEEMRELPRFKVLRVLASE